jgi:hypothetical protein
MAAGTQVASKIFELPKAVSLPGARLYFFATGTSTPVDVFTNIALSIPHSNPVVADSNGVFAPIYIDGRTGDLRVSLRTSADVVIYTIDDYLAGYGSTNSIDVTAANNPLIQLSQSGAAANQKNWFVQVATQQFKLSMANDAFSTQADFLTVSRSANTATQVNFSTSLLSYNGDPVRTGDSASKVQTETRNTTTTLTADSELTASLIASSKYLIECGLYFYATTTAAMGFKFDLAGTGGASLFNGRSGPIIQHVNGTGAVATLNTFPNTPISFGTISTNSVAVDSVQLSAYAETAAAGTIALRWAQASSSANNLNLANGSWIRATRL